VWTTTPDDGHDATLAVRDFLSRTWIDAQLRYHEANRDRRRRAVTRHHRLIWCLVLGVLASAIVHALEPFETEWVPHALSMVTICVPAWAAARIGLVELEQHELNAERSNEVYARLAEHRTRMESVTNMTELAEVVRDASTIMRTEAIGWFGVMRTREVPPPI
jgi:hypothetical protein